MPSGRKHRLSFAKVSQSTCKIIQCKKLKVYQDNLNLLFFTVFPKLVLGLWQMLKKGGEKRRWLLNPFSMLTGRYMKKEAPLSFTHNSASLLAKTAQMLMRNFMTKRGDRTKVYCSMDGRGSGSDKFPSLMASLVMSTFLHTLLWALQPYATMIIYSLGSFCDYTLCWTPWRCQGETDNWSWPKSFHLFEINICLEQWFLSLCVTTPLGSSDLYTGVI